MESVTHCITKGIKYENLSHMLSNSPKSSLDFFFKKIIPSEKHTLANYPCIESKHFFFQEAPELTTNPTQSNYQTTM